MSRTIPFHFVDVFAVEPLTGNSLAVVDCDAELALELMQKIAREFNQSETTFVLPATRRTPIGNCAHSRRKAWRFSVQAATTR